MATTNLNDILAIGEMFGNEELQVRVCTVRNCDSKHRRSALIYAARRCVDEAAERADRRVACVTIVEVCSPVAKPPLQRLSPSGASKTSSYDHDRARTRKHARQHRLPPTGAGCSTICICRQQAALVPRSIGASHDRHLARASTRANPS